MGESKNTIRFILDGELVEINDIDPTRTVLQYLREDIGRVGSKGDYSRKTGEEQRCSRQCRGPGVI